MRSNKWLALPVLNFSESDSQKIDQKLFKLVGIKKNYDSVEDNKNYSYWKNVARVFLAKKTIIVIVLLVLLIVLFAIIVPINKEVLPLPEKLPIPNSSQPAPVSAKYWFGLGVYGEDFWIKMWSGTRKTLLFMVMVIGIQLVFGIILGSIWGYFRKLDILFIEITKFFTLIPALIWWLLCIYIFGNSKSSLSVVMLAVGLIIWIPLASTIRVQMILIKNAEYNLASKMLGTNAFKIINKNILPRILPVILQNIALIIPTAFSIDATLHYLNFGFVDATDRSATSLGNILNEVVLKWQWQAYPHLILIPLFFIAIITTLLFFITKIIADSLDPKNHYH